MRPTHLLLASLLPAVAHAQDRLPAIPPAEYTDAQKQAAADYLAARKVPLSGPFIVMMHSPEVMSRARAMGDYLRYHSGIGNTLSELVIAITAREWSQDYEWSVHAPIALKAGIKPEIVAAIRDGHRPEGMSEDETIVYDVATELLRTKRVSDASFTRAEKRFGKPAIVDMVGIIGYYSLLAMQLNVARFPVPAGEGLPRFPE